MYVEQTGLAPSIQARDGIAIIGNLVGNLNDPYDALMWKGLLEGLGQHNCNSISIVCTSLTETGSDQTFAFSSQQLLRPEKFDALIVQTGALVSQITPESVKALIKRYRQATNVLSISVSLDNEPWIQTDNYSGMSAVVEHLIVEHGYRRIAFVTGPSVHAEAQVRLQAYQDMLAKYGIPLDEALICHGDFMITGGKKAVVQFYDGERLEMDAIVASNDTMAKAIINELAARGYSVPDDIAVTGYDNVLDAQCFSPSLTTVQQQIREQGRMAVERALAYLDDEDVHDGMQVQTPSELIIGTSCGCSPDQHGLSRDKESDTSLMRMAFTAPRLDVNGRRLMQSHSLEKLANMLHQIVFELRLAYCYVFLLNDSADSARKDRVYFLCGSNSDGLSLGGDDSASFPIEELMPAALWKQHERFNMLVEPLQFENDVLGYVVIDASLKEVWVYESLRTHLSAAIKTITLLEREKNYSAELERQVAARTAELEQLVQQRSQWLRIAGHDLRNPLSAISISADILALKGNRLTPQQIENCVQRIKDSKDNMNRIISRLLTIGRIDTGPIAARASYTNVSELMAYIIEGQVMHASVKQIKITSLIEPEVVGVLDSDLLEQVVVNLLTNSIKYSPSDTTIQLSLSKQDETIQIEIADEGQGFTESDRDQLYQQYATLSAQPTNGELSIGLGLFIVNKLVETMGGVVNMQSSGRNQGSVFNVSLPLGGVG